MSHLSIHLVKLAVIWLGLFSLGTALAVYLIMEVRYRRFLAREARRLILANDLFPSIDEETLRALWAESGRADREIITEILVEEVQSAGMGARGVEPLVVKVGIFEPWIRQLRQGGVDDRIAAAINLGHFHLHEGFEALARAAEDRSPEVRLAVTLSLGRLAAPQGLPALMRLARTPPHTMPALTLTAALAACAKGCAERLLDLLHAPDVHSRVIGAWALSEVADETVLPQLVVAAGDAEPEVRAKVARGLGRIFRPESYETLERLARDPVWFVRVRALDALGKLQAASADAAALLGLEDKVREVRHRAAYALRQIRGMRSEIVAKVLATSSVRGLNSLISEWERAGFLWHLVAGLSTRDWPRFVESQEVLKGLIRGGVTRALANFVLVFPDIKVRLRLVHLLGEAPSPSVRAELLTLASQPGCDRRVAAKIREAVPTAAII